MMGKIMKQGKVVLVLSGRFAGRKAIIVKPNDEGTSDKPFGHALIAGIDRYPRIVTKRMSKKKVKQRSKIKPFLKVVNYNHLMPTRYRRHCFGQRQAEQGSPQGSHEEKEGSSYCPHQIRRAIQEGQEQMVLLQVEILNFPYVR